MITQEITPIMDYPKLGDVHEVFRQKADIAWGGLHTMGPQISQWTTQANELAQQVNEDKLLIQGYKNDAVAAAWIVENTIIPTETTYSFASIDALLANKSDANHDHDGVYATLVNGTIPVAQLPSYVDDVLEYANFASFPAFGEAGKIYIAMDTGLTYRWSGSVYVEISSDTQAVWGNISGNILNQPDLQTAFGLKAALNSPNFTGSPTAPTPTQGDNSTKVATTAFVNSKINNDVGVANSGLVKTALNADGTAPIYACRAWVSFNGTGIVSIKSSGNVSSITDLGTGIYRVNFIIPMQDENYSCSFGAAQYSDAYAQTAVAIRYGTIPAVGSLDMTVKYANGTYVDVPYVSCNVFR